MFVWSKQNTFEEIRKNWPCMHTFPVSDLRNRSRGSNSHALLQISKSRTSVRFLSGHFGLMFFIFFVFFY